MLHLNDRLRTTCARWLVAAAVSLTIMPGSSLPGHAQSAAQGSEAAPSTDPAWKTSPFHGVIGGDGRVIPCRCLYRGRAYSLGEKVCMQTHLGTLMTECDLQLNNTSWVPTKEPCTTS